MSTGDNSRKGLTLDEASSLLGVSSSTVRNWVKHEYIKPVEGAGRFIFHSGDIKRLRRDIRSGTVARLGGRANKATANRTFIPDEYMHNSRNRDIINFLLDCIAELEIGPGRALFLLGLNLLKREDIIGRGSFSRIMTFNPAYFNNREAWSLLKEWHESQGGFDFRNDYDSLLSCDIPGERDFLGLIYQSLLQEGIKSHRGSYYTPQCIVDEIVSDHREPGIKVLDPCCGTGQFLLAFAETVRDPGGLYGFDTDKTAVTIARLNLIARFREIEFRPNIFHSDALLEKDGDCRERYSTEDISGFDVIATNPPWGTHYDKSDLAAYGKRYPRITSGESFSYFLARGIDLLKPEGRLSFILPESILTVRMHRDIRKLIVEKTAVEKISFLGRVFKNVFTPVIRLDLTKTWLSRGGSALVAAGGSTFRIDRKNFFQDKNFSFCINTRECSRMLDKIYREEHVTLKYNARWALGIVTGNNREFIGGTRAEGYEEIITGRDIGRFKIKEGTNFIKYEPARFQQMAPLEKYRTGEKLVYRFISKNLIFAYDNRKRLTLNSANILIPEIDGYPIKVILALFNSSLYQFIFQKKFSSIKVLRSHIEDLPLPLWERDDFDQVIFLTDCIMKGSDQFSELDSFIMNKFRLNRSEMKEILK